MQLFMGCCEKGEGWENQATQPPSGQARQASVEHLPLAVSDLTTRPLQPSVRGRAASPAVRCGCSKLWLPLQGCCRRTFDEFSDPGTFAH
jgi:hypothetical protein